MNNITKNKLQIKHLSINLLKPSAYNPRKWSKSAIEQLKKSIKEYGLADPVICNSAKKRKNIVIGGHFRLKIAKDLGYKEIPVVYVDIPDIEKEKKLNILLNKATGEFDFDLLANFDESFLSEAGFSSEELDEIFEIDDDPEEFDLKKELEKLNIRKITIKKGDVYQLGNNRMMCGDSTIKQDILKFMDKEKANMCLTDPPYILDYLKGKRRNDPTTGFGYKKNRRYLETDVLPDDFTEKWMTNIHRVAKSDFHILVFENWKNLRTIWDEMEKYWRVKNMIIWHLPNRTQGFASKYKFFSKHDICMVGTSKKDSGINLEEEPELLQNDYETALYAVSGKPHWEGYKKGKKICPTDFIEFNAADEKSSGQGIIFGTKPLEILIPYIKVLTQRNDLIIEPFGGSGSTLIAAEKMKRRCYLIEKSPVYAEVIRKRWEKFTSQKAEKIYGR